MHDVSCNADAQPKKNYLSDHGSPAVLKVGIQNQAHLLEVFNLGSAVLCFTLLKFAC